MHVSINFFVMIQVKRTQIMWQQDGTERQSFWLATHNMESKYIQTRFKILIKETTFYSFSNQYFFYHTTDLSGMEVKLDDLYLF